MAAKSDIISALNSVRDKALELQRDIKHMMPDLKLDMSKSSGISLIRAKYATLMRYNTNLVRYTQARVKGSDPSDVSNKLVNDLVVLGKIRPIEKKMQYQIDVLLKQLTKRRADGPVYRPDVSAMMDSDEEEPAASGGEEDDIYRPRKATEVAYDARDERTIEKERREKERYEARKLQTEGVREMLNEIKGRPEEIRDSERDGSHSKALQRLLREDDARKKFEEDNFVRLTVTRKDKRRKRNIERALDAPLVEGSDGIAGISTIADRVLTKKKSEGRTNRKLEDQLKKRRLEQIMRETHSDEETPSRNPQTKSNRKRRRR